MSKKHYFKIKQSRQSGFTLIELLVVISIITLLSTVILASVGSARASGRDAKREIESRSMMNAMYIFAGKHDGYVPYDGVAGNGTPSLVTYSCSGGNRLSALTAFGNALISSGSSPEVPIDPKNNGGFCYAYVSGPSAGSVNGRNVAESGSFYFISETKRCGEFNRKIGVSVGMQNMNRFTESGYPAELNDILNTGFRNCEGGSSGLGSSG